uniref:Small ribosomal subunit protein uS15 N-terminal domain-containing protein n=1 Tax=Macaca nemestrina TaxID=9545 RepID=A0A2K6DBQ0_MACNE
MGHMHAPGKGLSQSAFVPTWLKLTSDDVKEQIYKLAKKGLAPSQIGECWVLRPTLRQPETLRNFHKQQFLPFSTV